MNCGTLKDYLAYVTKKRPFVILRDERKNPQQLTLMQLLTTTARIAPEKRKYVATQAPPINKHTFVQKEFNRFN